MLEKIERRIEEIRKILNNSKNILVLFDTDADGLISYIIFKNYYNKKINGVPYYNEGKKKEFFFNSIKFENYDTILFLDKPFFDWESELFKNKKIVWIDHHPINEKFIKEHNIIFFNPLQYNLKNLPVCYWSYLFTKKKDKELALIGSVSDFFIIEELFEKNNLISKTELKKSRKKYPNEENLIRYLTYETVLSKYINIYNLIFKLKEEDLENSIKWIEKLGINELNIEITTGKNKYLNEIKKIEKKTKSLLGRALKENFKDIFYYEYSSKGCFTSFVINELCHKLKNWKIIILAHNNSKINKFTMSIRSNGIKINNIVEKIAKKYNGRGGGHNYAAGVSVDLGYKEDFKKELLNEFYKLIN